MESIDPRRVVADSYIREASQVLRAARSNYLDHTDAMTVKEALNGLRIVEHFIAGPATADAQIADRLRQLATSIKSCVEPDAGIASGPLEKAAGIFQAIADGAGSPDPTGRTKPL